MSVETTMAKEPDPKELLELLEDLPDPRMDRTKKHKLVDILTIAICGALCGVDNFVELERFGLAKQKWFETFLELSNGIPSHDTFGRVFAALDPDAFRAAFIAWVISWGKEIAGRQIAVDGKTLRCSHDRANGVAAIHMVNAFATESGLALGQVKTDSKSNEITAVPPLLEMLRLEGCLVTFDAMHCQKNTVQKVTDCGAEYLVALKANQGSTHDDVAEYFDDVRLAELEQGEGGHLVTTDGGHGRIEVRYHWYTDDVEWLQKRNEWPGLKGIGMVRRERTVGSGDTSSEVHYYLSGMVEPDVERFATAIRSHWAVENSLHWILDVAFDEDRCRARMGHAAENFAIIRQAALNLIKQEKTAKVGMKTKRKMCGWDHNYLLLVLSGDPTRSA